MGGWLRIFLLSLSKAFCKRDGGKLSVGLVYFERNPVHFALDLIYNSCLFFLELFVS